MSLYFEDFRPGETRDMGSRTVTREEILDFGRRFDPQPFHVDEEAARQSPFGGLIASGWHTAALCHAIVVNSLLDGESGSLGSPGVDELRWLKPVRPDDTLSVHVEVLEATPSRSKPGGLVKLRYTVRNQAGETVMTQVANGFFLFRPAESTQRLSKIAPGS